MNKLFPPIYGTDIISNHEERIKQSYEWLYDNIDHPAIKSVAVAPDNFYVVIDTFYGDINLYTGGDAALAYYIECIVKILLS